MKRPPPSAPHKNGVAPAGDCGHLLPGLLTASAPDRLQQRRTQLRRCLDTFSEEAVHRLRVTTRRLLAQVDLLAPLLPAEIYRDARRALKKQLKAMSALRDIQVQLKHVEEMSAKHPGLKSFRLDLLRRKRREIRAAEKKLTRNKYAQRIRRLEKAIHDIPATLRPKACKAYRTTLRGIVHHAFADIVKLQHRAAADPKWLHRMRIALKSYRYMAEILQPMLPEVTAKRLQDLQSFQRRTGDIHDLALLERRLTKFVARQQGQTGLEPCRKALARERFSKEHDHIELTPALLANHSAARPQPAGAAAHAAPRNSGNHEPNHTGSTRRTAMEVSSHRVTSRHRFGP